MIYVMIWNMFVITGASYLMTFHGWSNWTMLLAVILLASSTSKNK